MFEAGVGDFVEQPIGRRQMAERVGKRPVAPIYANHRDVALGIEAGERCLAVEPDRPRRRPEAVAAGRHRGWQMVAVPVIGAIADGEADFRR